MAPYEGFTGIYPLLMGSWERLNSYSRGPPSQRYHPLWLNMFGGWIFGCFPAFTSQNGYCSHSLMASEKNEFHRPEPLQQGSLY